jgi:CheY-like chemotaxis protein
VQSSGDFVDEQQDNEKLRVRVRELEALCTQVLVAGVDLGLPQHLLNQLWAVVGTGELPAAYRVDLSPAAATAEEPAPQRASAPPSPNPIVIPDISLSNRPSDDVRTAPPQTDLQPLTVKKTVAVVDDDPMMLDVLARILKRENYELLMAGGGPEMVQKMAAHNGVVDLLVTDYQMPGMKGRELAEHVRARFPAIKVLYQTGYSDLLFENRAELEEGEAFLEKPFTARGLREAARLVLFGSIHP